MTSCKKELLQLQVGPKDAPRQEPAAEGLVRNYRKVLIFSPERERLLAVMEPLSDHGHKCLFATTLKDAMDALRDESVGYLIMDGDNVSPDAQDALLAHLGLHRPDMHRKQKIHIFGARSAAELRYRFQASGDGINPLEY